MKKAKKTQRKAYKLGLGKLYNPYRNEGISDDEFYPELLAVRKQARKKRN